MRATFTSDHAVPPRRTRLPEPTLSTRLVNQIGVIKALMIRNIVAKYGRGNLGFLWLIVEPIFLLGGVIVIWTLLHPNGAHGISLTAFVMSGYLPLTLWRHLSNSVRVMSGSYGLLYHRRITVFDIIISRTLTEIAGVAAAGVIVYFMLLSLDFISPIEDASFVLLGWLMMCWFGFGVSCLVAGLSEKSEVLENLIQPTQYLMMPISGCFFMVTWLPKSVQDYALAVPLVHIYEIFRAGFFGRAVETHYSIAYVVVWSIGMTALGIWAMASSRKRLGGR
ncbi:MAG TPA: ABC transporter permease [Bosea sp. (in: a-proteobacteria)]|jgi:capsular polysaccharide transport system permease protein|nr:ABC transporter permease [Bosea sp. (in: a-proteobacteria)]